MELDSRRSFAQRRRRLTLAAMVLLAGVLAAGEAAADIQIHFMNCTTARMSVSAFDAKDAVEAFAASSKDFSADDVGASFSLHCAGQGRGYCKVQIAPYDNPCGDEYDDETIEIKVESDHWAVVTSFKKGSDTGGLTCKAVVADAGSSTPSCD
jgi:hypothetical protein